MFSFLVPVVLSLFFFFFSPLQVNVTQPWTYALLIIVLGSDFHYFPVKIISLLSLHGKKSDISSELFSDEVRREE